MIEIEALETGPVAVQLLTFSSGRVNAQDVELLKELTGALGELRSSGAGALVVTGAGRAFSAGVDLNRVVDGGAGYTDRLVPALSEAFEAMFSYPGPTVAAINGAAIAGGCVLACACDRRLIGPEAQIGASEVRVGVAFPVAALEVMRYACGDRAEDVLLGGRLYRGDEAIANGLPTAWSPTISSRRPWRRRPTSAASRSTPIAIRRRSCEPRPWPGCARGAVSTARFPRCGGRRRRSDESPPISRAFAGAELVVERDAAGGAPASHPM